MPWLPPVLSQPATLPSPAPMSDDTTATWMFGSPPGRFLSTSMNVGKLLSRFVCDNRIDDELSIMNSRSRLRFAIAALCAARGSSVWSDVQAETTATPTKAIHLD